MDLSSPELDSGDSSPEMSSSFTGPSSLSREHPSTSNNLAHNRRADSPPLEREERDFKQTANALQELRRSSQDSVMGSKSPEVEDSESVAMSVETAPDESEESIALRNHEAAAALFAEHNLSSSMSTIYDFSSPMLKPCEPHHVPQIESKSDQGMLLASAWHGSHVGKQGLHTEPMVVDDHKENMDVMDVWHPWIDSELRSPENVELDELECLFDAY